LIETKSIVEEGGKIIKSYWEIKKWKTHVFLLLSELQALTLSLFNCTFSGLIF